MLFWFRMHPVLYWLAGLAIIGFTAFMHFDSLQRNEARSAALKGNPPPAKPIEEFDEDRDSNSAKEAVIVAVLETEAIYTLTESKNGKIKKETWVAPLRPSSGAEVKEFPAALVEKSGAVAPDMLAGWIVGEVGGKPLIRVHGLLTTMPRGDRLEIRKALETEKLRIAENALLIDPFLKPRAEELKQRDPWTATSIVGGGGFLVFLYGFFRRWMRRRA